MTAEHGFSPTLKWRFVMVVDIAMGLTIVWWTMCYAYAKNWLAVAEWLIAAAVYWVFGLRVHYRWRQKERCG